MINETDIEAMKPIRWLKVPAPGQLRGEGEWINFDERMTKDGASEKEREVSWAFYRDSKYLPTKIQDEKPED